MYYKSSNQDSIEGRGKGVTRVINVPKTKKKVDVGAFYDLDQGCKWGDASLLDFDVLKVIKSILGEVAREHDKWIKEAKVGHVCQACPQRRR